MKATFQENFIKNICITDMSLKFPNWISGARKAARKIKTNVNLDEKLKQQR